MLMLTAIKMFELDKMVSDNKNIITEPQTVVKVISASQWRDDNILNTWTCQPIKYTGLVSFQQPKLYLEIIAFFI